MRYAVLLGPPNSGKSTLFNHPTEQHSSVINYPGSTTEVYVAKLKNHSSVSIIDLGYNPYFLEVMMKNLH